MIEIIAITSFIYETAIGLQGVNRINEFYQNLN